MTAETGTDISVSLFATTEGNFLASCVAAVRRSVRYAQAQGSTVSLTAILASPTPLTRRVAESVLDGGWRVLDLPRADVSEARNAARAEARGRCVAFVDADDLWCETWLHLAAEAACRHAAVWRPELLLTFGTDFHAHGSAGYATTFQPLLLSEPAILLTQNTLPSGFLAPREIVAAHPWPALDAERGWLAVDRWWSCDVAAASGEHRAVPGTFHYRRRHAAFDGTQLNLPEREERGIGPTRLASVASAHRPWPTGRGRP